MVMITTKTIWSKCVIDKNHFYFRKTLSIMIESDENGADMIMDKNQRENVFILLKNSYLSNFLIHKFHHHWPKKSKSSELMWIWLNSNFSFSRIELNYSIITINDDHYVQQWTLNGSIGFCKTGKIPLYKKTTTTKTFIQSIKQFKCH